MNIGAFGLSTRPSRGADSYLHRGQPERRSSGKISCTRWRIKIAAKVASRGRHVAFRCHPTVADHPARFGYDTTRSFLDTVFCAGVLRCSWLWKLLSTSTS
jgi:hypothetical protein